MKPRDPNTKLDARCNACRAHGGGTRAELVAAQWLPCPRKGGKLEWMCPKCNPTLTPGYTGPTRAAWTKKE